MLPLIFFRSLRDCSVFDQSFKSVFTQAEQREDLDSYPSLGTHLNSLFRALLIRHYFILSAQIQLLSTHTLGEMSERKDPRILKTRVFPRGVLWVLTSLVVVGMLGGLL